MKKGHFKGKGSKVLKRGDRMGQWVGALKKEGGLEPP